MVSVCVQPKHNPLCTNNIKSCNFYKWILDAFWIYANIKSRLAFMYVSLHNKVKCSEKGLQVSIAQ